MASEQPQGVWWLSPPGAVALVVPITLLLAVRFDDAHFRFAWHSPKALTSSTAALFAAGALLFAIGGLWPLVRRPAASRRAWPPFSPLQLDQLRRASNVPFLLTLAGYSAFAVSGVTRGATLAEFLQATTNQNNFGSPLRTQFAPVAGVTTLTQLGIAYTVVGVVLYCQERDRRAAHRLVLVLVLALVRTFFLAERLALLELVIPAVAVASLWAASRSRRQGRVLVRLAPIILVPAVIVIFSLFEYSRSWVFYSKHSQGSFAEFATDRLAGYYTTAYNNGQLAMTYDSGGSRLPYGSVEAVWTAPVLSQLHTYETLTGTDEPATFEMLLAQHGNPEFNSPGGLAVPFVDYGPVGGLVFLFVAGSALGVTYRRCCEGSSWAVLIYPVVVTGLFELPRYLYWGQGRVAPALVGLLAVHLRLRSVTSSPAQVPEPV